MKKLNSLFVLLLVALLVPACVKERSADMESGEKLALRISARAFVPGASVVTIGKIRLILFDGTSKKIILNSTTENGQLVNDGGGNFAITVPLGTYQYYIVVNEPVEVTEKFQNKVGVIDEAFFKELKIYPKESSTEADITLQNSGSITISRDPNAPDRALGTIDIVSAAPSNPTMISLFHTQAKVSLFVRKDSGVADDVVIHRVEVINTTTESSLFFNGDFINEAPTYWQTYTPYKDPLVGTTITQSGGATEKDGNNYHEIFKNRVIGSKTMADKTNSANATCLMIYATYKGVACFYKVPLLTKDDDGSSNYSITQSVHYRVYANIKKAGEGIAATIELQPWVDGGTIDVEEKPGGNLFLNVSELSAGFIINTRTDANKTFTKRFYFWSNKSYDEITLEKTIVSYTDSGEITTCSLEEYEEYIKTETSMPVITVQKVKTEENSGHVDVSLKTTNYTGIDRMVVTFYLKVGNLNRKITITYDVVNIVT